LDLQLLLLEVTLGEQEEVMMRSQRRQGLLDAVDDLDVNLEDAQGKLLDVPDRLIVMRAAELGERFPQAAGERAGAVTVHHLETVEHLTDLCRGQVLMREERDEFVEGTLVVDVVLPQRVICIEQ